MKLIIPSANRYNKLARTLEYYDELGLINTRLDIHILDGSNSENASRYIKLCEKYKITYLAWNNLGLNERLLKASSEIVKSDELFFIGNDEDVFTPGYIDSSIEFMTNNIEYSTYIGKYFTLARPILGINRVPFERLTISTYHLDADEPRVRMNMLSKLLLVGISPLFYGIRRGSQFHLSCKVFNDIEYGGAGEFADQILLSFSGKIYCHSQIMLVRDETKIKHIKAHTHQRTDSYITKQDLSELNTAIKNHININQDIIEEFSTNWIPIDENKNTIALTKFRKYYSPYESGKYKNSLNTIYRIFITLFEIINYFQLKRQLTEVGLATRTINKLLKKTEAK